VANLNKLIKEGSTGTLTLALNIEYDPHFKTSEKIKVSDFISSKTYVLAKDGTLLSLYGVDDKDLDFIISSYNEPFAAGHISENPESLVLVPHSMLNDLSGTNIEEGYLDGSRKTWHNILIVDRDGCKLISKLSFSQDKFYIRDAINQWTEQVFEYELTVDEGGTVVYKSEFLASYMFISGNDYKALIQDTRVVLDHIDKYDDPVKQKPLKEYSKDVDELPIEVELVPYNHFQI